MIDKSRQAVALLRKNLPIFIALGNPTRQRIMMLLSDGTHRNVAELAKETGLARPTVSHHIKILKKAGLLIVSKQGVNYYYSPQYSTPLKSLREFVSFLEKIENKEETDAETTQKNR